MGPRGGRAGGAFREPPPLAAAVVAQALAHAVMVAVMIMTPLHMEHGGSHLQVIGFVISLHVLGMYAFSPLIGWFVDRAGSSVALACGAGLLLASLLLSGLSPSGHSWTLTAGLFLLGVGWSFCTLAAAASIAERAPLRIRTDVQGVSDMVMGLTAAAGGAVAGVLVAEFGYAGLAAVSACFAVAIFGSALVIGRHGRHATP